jgi:hypothetical protein
LLENVMKCAAALLFVTFVRAAIPQSTKADKRWRVWNVRFVPLATGAPQHVRFALENGL